MERTQETVTRTDPDMATMMAEAFRQALLQVENRQSRPKLQAQRPDTFEGTRSASIIDGWLRSVERYGDLMRMTEQEQVKLATTLVRGRADTWLRRLEAAGTVPTTWNGFKTSIQAAFQPVHSLEMARDKLAALEQTGSVETYVDAFQNLSLAVSDLSPAEAKDKFVRGLKPNVRAYVRTQVPDTVDAAFHLAMAYEGGQGMTASSGHGHARAPAPPMDFSQSTPMDLDVLYQPRYQNSKKGDWRGGRQVFEKRCYNCDGRGHLQRDCPSPRYEKGGRNDLKDQARRE